MLITLILSFFLARPSYANFHCGLQNEEFPRTLSGAAILPFGESTFFDRQTNTWFAILLHGTPFPGRTQFKSLRVVRTNPTYSGVIDALFESSKTKTSLFDLNTVVTFSGCFFSITNPAQAQIQFDQHDLMLAPATRTKGLPLASLTISSPEGPVTFNRFQRVRASPQPKDSLTIEETEALALLNALKTFDERISPGELEITVQVPFNNYFGAANQVPAPTEISLRKNMNMAQAAVIEAALNAALKAGRLSPEHPALSFPPIARVREFLRR